MVELKFKGNTNDLLLVNDNPPIKQTRLVWLANAINESDEIIDVAITSSSENGKHGIFDKLIGKEIEVVVKYEE